MLYLLYLLYLHKSKAESVTSKALQDVLDFLCERFGVVGDLYDQWVEENALPLPPSTLQVPALLNLMASLVQILCDQWVEENAQALPERARLSQGEPASPCLKALKARARHYIYSIFLLY